MKILFQTYCWPVTDDVLPLSYCMVVKMCFCQAKSPEGVQDRLMSLSGLFVLNHILVFWLQPGHTVSERIWGFFRLLVNCVISCLKQNTWTHEHSFCANTHFFSLSIIYIYFCVIFKNIHLSFIICALFVTAPEQPLQSLSLQ